MAHQLPASPAAERNKAPILAVLESELSSAASVLEIASGTGQHVCFFAAALPDTRWQPSEPGDADREAIAIRIRECGLTNVELPVALDVSAASWPVDGEFDAMLCINMIHIAPWPATLALMRGAGRHLKTRGKLILYGPYLENGTAVQSNLDFDASLKRRNPEWGLRDLEEVTRVAAEHGLRLQTVVRMPANNLTAVFARER